MAEGDEDGPAVDDECLAGLDVPDPQPFDLAFAQNLFARQPDQTNSIFGSFMARSAMMREARSSSRRCTT